MLKKIYQNQSGAIAIMMTILTLASILSITMIANNIILNNLSMNIVQVGATKAFFASEAGAEMTLWKIRKGNFSFSSCVSGQNINFTNNNCGIVGENYPLSNNSEFSLIYEKPDVNTIITSFGVYGDTARNTQIEY